MSDGRLIQQIASETGVRMGRTLCRCAVGTERGRADLSGHVQAQCRAIDPRDGEKAGL